jgi:hypothetical protein
MRQNGRLGLYDRPPDGSLLVQRRRREDGSMVSVTSGGSENKTSPSIPAISIGRWRVTGSQEPVYRRGATNERVAICPGDFVLCDDDGGIIIPQVKVMPVPEAAEELTRKEILIRNYIADGNDVAASPRQIWTRLNGSPFASFVPHVSGWRTDAAVAPLTQSITTLSLRAKLPYNEFRFD